MARQAGPAGFSCFLVIYFCAKGGLRRGGWGVCFCGVGFCLEKGEEFFFAGGRVYGLDAEGAFLGQLDRESTRLNSSHVAGSYAVFCSQKDSPYSQVWTISLFLTVAN